MALGPRRKHDRDHPDPAHHHGGSHHGQDRRAGQGRQAERAERHAGRDRPERPQADAGPQARRGPQPPDGQAVPADAPGGQLQLQLQHPGLGPAPGDGGAGDPAGVDGLPDRMRPPPHLLRPARQGKAAASAGGPGGHPAGHRQGHPDHPGDRGRGRGGAQPDDRLRHRRGPGRVCGRDPAAPPEPGVYPQAHRRDRGAETGDRRPERHPGQARPHPPDHHPGADGGGQKVRPAPPQRDPLRPARRRRCRRGGGGARLPRHRLFHPGGLFEKDHPPEPAHSRRPQAERGRRDRGPGRGPQQPGSPVLHRPAPGLQDPPVRV